MKKIKLSRGFYLEAPITIKSINFYFSGSSKLKATFILLTLMSGIKINKIMYN